MQKHFSHRHGLVPRDVKAEDEILCSGCELSLSGSAFACSHSDNQCNFYLHESCFHLPRKIQHESHPEHPLKLLPFAPYDVSAFSCSVCPRNGNAFVYHCSACEFDLHVECAFPKETVNGQRHESYADQLRAHSEMQDALAACQLESEIARRGRQAILDSLDPPNVVRRYYYY
ncbi:hypothetical protein RJ640_013548 [Escallonia rubra]|uniref:DC1 domain-containing protein n=1 Tax=Escallonia rubra TaxID=112253 RepID=A0AA88UEY7_9ASTE|nr:hypothetical protein RJ640_013548 [Escallonia rubra]